jgi:hypothetical protein
MIGKVINQELIVGDLFERTFDPWSRWLLQQVNSMIYYQLDTTKPVPSLNNPECHHTRIPNHPVPLKLNRFSLQIATDATDASMVAVCFVLTVFPHLSLTA